jgi:hypothetical protein
MEYLNGKDLLTLMRELRARRQLLPPELAGYIAQQVAAGLGYAHSLTQIGGKSLNIVHRDVSPSNIMLLRAGGVKLLDFGIAKATTDVRNMSTTQVGLVKGKLSYLSPEQVRGGDLDGRSDVFALGVVLWECLTGKRLFFDRNDYQTMRNVAERPVPPPSTQRADVPPALDFIVMRALERDVDQRYGSARQMADDLEKFLQETRFSPSALPRFLDELYGAEAPEIEEQVPAPPLDAVLTLEPESPLIPRPPEEGASKSLSGGVPPVQVVSAAPVRRDSKTVLVARRRRRGLIITAAAAGLLGAVGAPFLLGDDEDRTARAPHLAAEREPGRLAGAAGAASPATGAPPTGAAPAMAPGEPPASAAAAPLPSPSVTVKIDSTPPGADVRGATGTHLGVTPLTVTMPRGLAPLVLTVGKLGFESVKQSVVPDRDVGVLVTLRPHEAAAPRAARPPARARGRAGVAAPRVFDGRVREGLSIDPFEDGR